MVKSTIYAALAASAVFAMQCGTAEKSTVLKDPQGKVIGRYDTMSDSEARASFDTNQNESASVSHLTKTRRSSA